MPKGKGERVHLSRADAEALAAGLSDTTYDVRSVESKPYRRSPYAPFRTTTLQQEASRKLGMSASVTMSVAQRLYENGFITYMRTDSTTLSGGAVGAARDQVRELYGAEYLPDSPRTYASKVKNAQEAHEAIRPAGESFRTPAQTGPVRRAVPALRADLDAHRRLADEGRRRQLGDDPHRRRRRRRPRRRLQRERSHDHLPRLPQGLRRGHRRRLQAPATTPRPGCPTSTQGAAVSAATLTPEGHETKPPSRYTEATLIKELEDREIGRPSTYASIIGTILNRGYVYKKGTALVPAWLAFSVVRLLEEHFPRQVSYEFTASMEDVLDEIAGGRKDRATELGEFYYGAGDVVGPQDAGHRPRRHRRQGDGDLPDRAEGINLRVGRYGPYVEGPPSEEGDGAPVRANVPDDLPPDELTVAKAKELLANPAGEEQVVGNHPDTGLQIVAKNGRFGPYVTELLPEDAPKSAKPRTGSLFKSMTLDTVSLEEAVKLLDLPRVVGTDEDGTEITAQNGRYGPYLKKGTDSRSLTSEDQIFDITLDQAKAIYAQPKQRGRGAATPPLKELGNDPVSGQPVVVKAGRFGEYVTDGEYNATLRKDDSVEAITLERAAELLAERRERGPAKKAAKKGAKKAPAKKTAAKKTTAKKTAAKKTTKKAAAKKS